MGLSNLPLSSGEKHAATFERLGWTRDYKRRGRGVHILLTKPGMRATLSIPNEREVKRTIIASLIRAAAETETSYINAFYGR
jgi:predicted RNA binding protein YcfA (HicA-like mRNA interferase family)